MASTAASTQSVGPATASWVSSTFLSMGYVHDTIPQLISGTSAAPAPAAGTSIAAITAAPTHMVRKMVPLLSLGKIAAAS